MLILVMSCFALLGDSQNGKFSYGYASSPGKRSSMEDFYETRIDGIDGEIVGLFGVFDGEILFSNASAWCNFCVRTACKTWRSYLFFNVVSFVMCMKSFLGLYLCCSTTLLPFNWCHYCIFCFIVNIFCVLSGVKCYIFIVSVFHGCMLRAWRGSGSGVC